MKYVGAHVSAAGGLANAAIRVARRNFPDCLAVNSGLQKKGNTEDFGQSRIDR
ncbi:hypothetical protein [Enterobacter asburiae]|uniref:hypothetical protein n=1 Tax=Enterobacter asburiae TaxID=61645 RepID=UPI003EE6715B